MGLGHVAEGCVRIGDLDGGQVDADPGREPVQTVRAFSGRGVIPGTERHSSDQSELRGPREDQGPGRQRHVDLRSQGEDPGRDGIDRTESGQGRQGESGEGRTEIADGGAQDQTAPRPGILSAHARGHPKNTFAVQVLTGQVERDADGAVRTQPPQSVPGDEVEIRGRQVVPGARSGHIPFRDGAVGQIADTDAQGARPRRQSGAEEFLTHVEAPFIVLGGEDERVDVVQSGRIIDQGEPIIGEGGIGSGEGGRSAACVHAQERRGCVRVQTPGRLGTQDGQKENTGQDRAGRGMLGSSPAREGHGPLFSLRVPRPPSPGSRVSDPLMVPVYHRPHPPSIGSERREQARVRSVRSALHLIVDVLDVLKELVQVLPAPGFGPGVGRPLHERGKVEGVLGLPAGSPCGR